MGVNQCELQITCTFTQAQDSDVTRTHISELTQTEVYTIDAACNNANFNRVVQGQNGYRIKKVHIYRGWSAVSLTFTPHLFIFLLQNI